MSAEYLTDFPGLLQLCRELGRSWRDASRGDVSPAKGKRLDHMVMVYGLATHTHLVGAAALDHLEQGSALVAVPLVRAAYETAITAHWVAQVPDAADAMFNELVRQRTATAAVMVRTGIPHIATGATKVQGPELEKLWSPSSSDAAGRAFAQRCDDLSPGGAEAYLNFRLMSERVHPTAVLVHEYVESVDEDITGPVGMRLDPKSPSPDQLAMWAFFTAASLVWADRAFDYFDPKHVRRSELRAAAKRLGIALELRLSDTARQRLAAAKRKQTGPDDRSATPGPEVLTPATTPSRRRRVD